ncbi:MAG: CgeB family protein [Pseudomonadota bacterium]
MTPSLDIVFIGLSLSSSWGNGHATTFRSLIRGLAELGHRVHFLEREVPWYSAHRDLADPDFCRLAFYHSVSDLRIRHGGLLRNADAIVIGSFVPQGVEVIDDVARLARGALCFYDIDTPVTLAKLEAGDEAYLAARQIPHFDVYFSFTGGPTILHLQEAHGARKAHALYCSVDAVRYAPTGETPVWQLGYLGTYSADRQPALETLMLEVARRMPDRRFVVAGPQYPQSLHWPRNVDRIEHLAPAEHASFYCRQRFTLNLTRRDMIAAGYSPSVRLFEAAACGTPLISDRWPGLTELFPDGEAICIADNCDDVCAMLATGESRRRGMAEQARQRVISSHTGTARARELIACLPLPSRSARHPALAAVSSP